MAWSNTVNYELVSVKTVTTKTFFRFRSTWLVEKTTEETYESNALVKDTAQAEARTGSGYSKTGDTTTQTVVEAIRTNNAGGWTARKTVTTTTKTKEDIE